MQIFLKTSVEKNVPFRRELLFHRMHYSAAKFVDISQISMNCHCHRVLTATNQDTCYIKIFLNTGTAISRYLFLLNLL